MGRKEKVNRGMAMSEQAAPGRGTPAPGGGIGSQSEWEAHVARLFEEGEVFLAQDLAEGGLVHYPGSARLRLVRALALARTGAADEALKTLEPLTESLILDRSPFQKALKSLQQVLKVTCVPGSGDDSCSPTKPDSDSGLSQDVLTAITQLADALEKVRGKRMADQGMDETLLIQLGDVYVEAWSQARQQGDKTVLARAHDLYAAAFTASAVPQAAVKAALTAQLMQDRASADRFARAALHIIALDDEEELGQVTDPVETFWRAATAGLASLLLGKRPLAAVSYRQARLRLERGRYAPIVAARQQLAMLQQGGVEVPEAVLEALSPPKVVVFTGHMLDHPNQQGEPCFPAHLEAALKAEIQQRLEALDPHIGYSSAAAGADLLFVEAMLERGSEIHIILPFDLEDFVAHAVRYAGSRWEKRFRNALKLANSVSYATTEKFLGHGNLFRFMNQMLHGMATLRSRFLHTDPYLLAVWNYREGSLVGGAADFIDQWADITRLQIIDLDTLLEENPAPDKLPAAAATPLSSAAAARMTHGPALLASEEETRGRVIKVSLFADIKGFSKLGEEHVPAYIEFFHRLHKDLAGVPVQPEMINTWGDAIFAVMGRATDMARYALALKAAVAKQGNQRAGMPTSLNIRISLHAGPVYETIDPFRKATNFFGAHINRAARLEPVTVPGHVYATQQFVALLTAEESALRNEVEATGGVYHSPVACEYVGTMALAKGFGHQQVYHLRDA